MRTFVLAFLLFIGPKFGLADEATATKCDRIHISSVSIEMALFTYHQIEDCYLQGEQTTVYVSGVGGTVSDSLVFFDLMRSKPEMCNQVTFVALGRIASVSNITWLAGCKRAALPHVSFHLHRATLNMADEDDRARTTATNVSFDDCAEAVRLAAGEKAAQLWQRIFRGDEQGIVLTTKEALELGWITEVIKIGEP